MLHDLAICQQIVSHDIGYLLQWPSHERIAETIQRIEEDSTGVEAPIAPMGVVVEVLPGLNVEEFPTAKRGDCDPLTDKMAVSIQQSLDRYLKEGPPAHWRYAGSNQPLPVPGDGQPPGEIVRGELPGPKDQPRSAASYLQRISENS
jgi:hypothetical protein